MSRRTVTKFIGAAAVVALVSPIAAMFASDSFGESEEFGHEGHGRSVDVELNAEITRQMAELNHHPFEGLTKEMREDPEVQEQAWDEYIENFTWDELGAAYGCEIDASHDVYGEPGAFGMLVTGCDFETQMAVHATPGEAFSEEAPGHRSE